jgi:hypothetical protein
MYSPTNIYMGFCFPLYRALFIGAPLYNSALVLATAYPVNIPIQENQYKVISGFLSRPPPRFMGLVCFRLVAQFCHRPGLPPWALLPFTVFGSSWRSVLRLQRHLHQFHAWDGALQETGITLAAKDFLECQVQTAKESAFFLAVPPNTQGNIYSLEVEVNCQGIWVFPWRFLSTSKEITYFFEYNSKQSRKLLFP